MAKATTPKAPLGLRISRLPPRRLWHSPVMHEITSADTPPADNYRVNEAADAAASLVLSASLRRLLESVAGPASPNDSSRPLEGQQ